MRITKGLSLIEISISVVVLMIMLQAAMPYVSVISRRQKEYELRYSLRKIREGIDRFYTDHMNYTLHDRYPKDLEELVNEHYMRHIPIDPFTGKDDWITISTTDDKDKFIELSTDKRNVFDIRSSSKKIALDGSKYADW